MKLKHWKPKHYIAVVVLSPVLVCTAVGFAVGQLALWAFDALSRSGPSGPGDKRDGKIASAPTPPHP